MKKHIILTLTLIVTVLYVFAQVIPSNRLVDWSDAGFPGEFPDPVTVVNVIDFGATGNGTTNDYPAVSGAIGSLAGNPGIVWFPAGTYLLNSGLNLPNNVILRGVSSSQTLLKFSFGGANTNGINIAGQVASGWVSLMSGYTKGSVKILVSNPAGFTAGNYVEIRQDNGSWDTDPATWAEHAVGQINKIAAVSGDTLVLEEPLNIDYSASLMPEVSKFTPKSNIGIETLKMERVDNTTSGGPFNISISYATNCWVRGVESNKSVGSHIVIRSSTHIEISGCYFHDAFAYDGASNHGYGVTLTNHCGNVLIENNIFKHLRHAMMVKVGANDNVFGYNYSLDVYRTEYPNNFAGDISLHGHYSFCNLFEGNIVQNIYTDHEWGPSGPYNTFFRNRAELYGIIITSGTQTTSNQNYVGNEVTNTGFMMGQYSLAGTGHFEFGNNVKGTITPPGTNNLPDLSYYYASKPPFWDVAMNWPTIGIPNTISTGTIQAKLRYGNSHFTYILPVADAGDDVTIDEGNSTSLNGTVVGGIGAYTWSWFPVTGLSNPNIANPLASPLVTTSYTLTVKDMYGVVDTDEVVVTVNPAVPVLDLQLKVFLEGPFITTAMSTDLNSQSFLPLVQPYSGDPWFYPGTEAVAAIPGANVVDWILVEIRDAATASAATAATVKARQAGFILNDGSVVPVSGSGNMTFNVTIDNNLFAVVRHRNHLSVMSANPVIPSGNLYTYDFSDSFAKVYGGNIGYKELVTGIFGMIAGDGDSDGQITNGDKNDVWILQAGLSGYRMADFNMNGNVDNADKIESWAPNSGRGTQVP